MQDREVTPMKLATGLLSTVLLFGLSVLILHAGSSDKATPSTPSSSFRYTAVELAEESIEAYEALETNNVALAKEILMNAIVNYIEDDERGGSAVKSDSVVEQKAMRVRDKFSRIHSGILKSQP